MINKYQSNTRPSGDSDRQEFDLKKHGGDLERMLPVISASKKADLSSCNLTRTSCIHLSAVSSSSCLKHLDLSNNNIEDYGVQLLCSSLNSGLHKLETLSLSGCNLTKSSCMYLSTVSNSSCLKHLDLSKNNIGDDGVNELYSIFRSNDSRIFKLETLSLNSCNLNSISGLHLFLCRSHCLKQLDLSNNNIEDTGVKWLLDRGSCKLETLSLSGCNLTSESCSHLSAVPSSSCLKHLDLSNNNLQDGVEKLYSELHRGLCKLETLSVSSCNLTKSSCIYLSFISSSSCLKHLDLSNNNIEDYGVQHLYSALEKGLRKLETLNLSSCNLTRTSCSHLSAVSSSSCLKHLDLSNNNIEDYGVQLLCCSLNSGLHKLETLSLSSCNLTKNSCFHLSSVSSSSCLKHLDLSNNNLEDTGVHQLCSALNTGLWKVDTLSLSSCNITWSGCNLLSSVSVSSCLKHLDLSNNNLENTGVQQLCIGLNSGLLKLNTLRLSGFLASEHAGLSLVSALSSSLPHLKDLDLSLNNSSPTADLLNALVTLRLDPSGGR